MMRVTTSAVNKLAATPIVSVTPKPRISPVPCQIRMMDEMSVVTCESKIVNSEGAAITGGNSPAQRLALLNFFAQAFARHKSTRWRPPPYRDGEHDTGDARQGQSGADAAHADAKAE